jgi:hypothetical protein
MVNKHAATSKTWVIVSGIPVFLFGEVFEKNFCDLTLSLQTGFRPVELQQCLSY